MPENNHSDAPVYSFPKNSREEVRAQLSHFKGHRLADIRVWAVDDDDVDVPTKRGVSVRVEQLPELLAAVQALCEAAEVTEVAEAA